MEDCIFCKIINGEIPSYKIYEDEVVYAFLDITQVTPGHTLVVPKKHAKDIFEYDEELASQVFTRIPKIARALEKAYPDMQGLNIINNNREVAYQSVFHSHIHLIPRFSPHDDFSMHFGNHQDQYNPTLMEAIAKRIRESFE
ncbi:HIT family protein [Enterococcus cecorum]|uniref:Histidine triad protein n=1 Tax=Enterococcus cecorum DSM 20682 = ATCC 43198 TaxID=1121864 RepID=S1RQZ0_9ENTE|nr:HIT family protein [Enterococcus cecorum]EOX18927.1 histidine triad protein [Enterococcus cecorum DSM 20682 = ATCC 43198]ESK61344.1 histidine triad protein [Enterococcus cecorum DSM 20682 = ATCC 43198]KLN93216.1 histidine triad protein [Enterococcus cecorum]KLN93344.1 histidine triad protein [Enterococcus cecorum]KLO65856.1 histidine triad protein [Enterococcus cecorum]